jgi:hypothetical protein
MFDLVLMLSRWSGCSIWVTEPIPIWVIAVQGLIDWGLGSCFAAFAFNF